MIMLDKDKSGLGRLSSKEFRYVLKQWAKIIVGTALLVQLVDYQLSLIA